MYAFYYTLSIIDRGEVMVDADLSLSDSDSKSVMEIFNSFPGVSQQPQQLPPLQPQQQRQLERPPSSLSETPTEHACPPWEVVLSMLPAGKMRLVVLCTPAVAGREFDRPVMRLV